MKHYSICTDCRSVQPNTLVWAVGEVNANLIAICQCPAGHRWVTGLMHDLFDILYTSALSAFLKEAFSESVLSFTAALERAYEFFIKVTMYKDGVTLVQLEEFWKEIKTQSERQYGAFCLSYVKATGAAWKSNKKQVEFRNKVVHQGYIATSTEVREYATYITERLCDILFILKRDYKEECTQIYFYEKELLRPKIQAIINTEPGLKYSSASFPSLLHWNSSEPVIVTFEQALDNAKDLFAKFEGRLQLQ